VNIVGRLRNNNYTDNEGAEVYALAFTAEEIDYLDSRAESEARRSRLNGEHHHQHGDDEHRAGGAPAGTASNAAARNRKPRTERQSVHA
jgi:single-strand DNA-binding protein